MDWDAVVALGLRLQGVEAGTHDGRPALLVRGKLLACMGEEEDHFLVLLAPQRAAFLARRNPERFFQSPSYLGSPFLQVRYAELSADRLKGLFADAWSRRLMERLGED